MFQTVMGFELLRIAGTSITVATLATAVAILVASLAFSRIVQRAIHRAVAGQQAAARLRPDVLSRLTHFAIVFMGFTIALDTLGIDLGTLFAAGAVFAVGLGFAMQNIAQNFVSGVILLLERSIKPGDVIAVDGTVVRVRDMQVRTTIATTRDDEELIIPNSLLVQSTVKNYTLQDSLYRLRASVGVIYSSDLRLVRETLERVANDAEWRSVHRAPRIHLVGFGSSSVDFDVSVWMDDPWEAPRSLSRLNEEIWWALRDVGVTIAFPQLDVHFDRPIEQSLRGLAGAP